jgi:1-acyl-sn-glycerol-3-phosphate acyltransferase
MVGLLQVMVTIILTYLYSDSLALDFSVFGIFKILLIFVILNVIFTVLVMLIFVIFIYTTEKWNSKSTFKHYFALTMNVYIFNFLFRVRPIISGKENLPKNNNFVVFSNHIAFSDPLYIMQAYRDRPLAFVAKDNLFKVPIIKNLIGGMGCVSISRTVTRDAMTAILESVKKVKNGQPMGIFPEGTRSYKNDLGEFKPGALKLATKAKADISPVCVYDMHKIARRFRILPIKVYIKVLPMIKYEDYKDLDSPTLSKKLYDITEEALNEFKAKYKK